jgi:hypothetical protein
MTEKEERILEALQLFSTALENAVQILKQELANLDKKQVPAPAPSGLTEECFSLLKWDPGKGEKLGEFETAFRNSNNIGAWTHAFKVLKANAATIQNHLSPEGFSHYYWLYLEKYEDRIFRKKREGPS